MSSQTYRLNIEVQSDGAKRGVDGLKTSLNSLEKDTSKAGKALNELDNKTQLVSKSFGALKGLIGVLGLSVGIGSIIQTADSMQVLNDQVRLATGTAEKYGVAMQNIERIAMSNRVSLQSVGEMYVSNERALKQLGKSQEQVIAFTENVTKAMRVGGGSAESQAAALTQLGQALASGVLRGDEFNSIAEQAPMIMELMADSLNVTTGELRKMAGEGKLTAEAVYQALTSAEASQKLGAMTGQTATTVTGALQVVKNQWDIAVNKFMNGENGISQALANIIIKISDIIPKVVEFGQAFAGSEIWQVGIAGLGTAFEVASIAIGNTLAVLTPIGDFITNHSDLVLALSTGLLAGATAYGAITLAMGVFATASTAVATAGGVMNLVMATATGVMGAFGAVMAVVTSPITLAVVAVGALAAAGVYLYQNWEQVSDIIGGTIEQILINFDELKSQGIATVTAFKDGAIAKFNEFKNTAKSVFDGLPAPVQTALRVVGNAFGTQFALIKNVVQTSFHAIKALVRGDMEGVKTAIFNGIQNAWNIVKTGAGNIVREFAGLGGKLRQAGIDAIAGFIGGIRAKMKEALDVAKNLANSVWGTVKSALDIRSPSRKMKELGVHTADGMTVGIKKGTSKAVKQAQKMAEDIKKAVADNVSNLKREIALFGDDSPINALKYDIGVGKYGKVDTKELESLTAQKYALERNKIALDEIFEINKQIETQGLNRLEILQWEIDNTQKYAGILPEHLEKLKVETERLTTAQNQFSVQEKIKALDEKILLVGKSELEVLQHQLDHAKEYQGVSNEIKQTYLERTKALQDEIKSNERLNALQKARDDFAKQQFISQNPQDKYAGQRFDLQKQGFSGGQIDELVGYQAKTDAFSAFVNLQNTLKQNLPKNPMVDLQAQYDERLAIIRQARQSELGVHAEFNQAETELSSQFLQAKNELMITQSESLLGGMAQTAKTAFGEQSKAYRMIFAMEKGMAIARSVMAIQTAMAQAAANPFPMNLGAMATVASQVANIVGNIKAVAMPIGQAHDGIMSVPKSGTWNLEKGERVLPKHTAKALDDKLNTMGGGGQTIIVNVTVNSDGTASVDSQSQMGKQWGETIKVAVRQELIRQQKQGWLLYGR